MGTGATEDEQCSSESWLIFFFQAEDGIRDVAVTGVQTCALPISAVGAGGAWRRCAVRGGRVYRVPGWRGGRALSQADRCDRGPWRNSDSVPDEPAARQNAGGKGGGLCGGQPRLFAPAGFRAGENVCAERRDF